MADKCSCGYCQWKRGLPDNRRLQNEWQMTLALWNALPELDRLTAYCPRCGDRLTFDAEGNPACESREDLERDAKRSRYVADHAAIFGMAHDSTRRGFKFYCTEEHDTVAEIVDEQLDNDDEE